MEVATADETLRDLLDRSLRTSVPIRRTFLQLPDKTPGPLASFVTGEEARICAAWLVTAARNLSGGSAVVRSGGPASIGVEPLPKVAILRNRSGGAYTKETLNKDFAKVRSRVLGANETRMIMDMRRSGAVEAMAGNVDDGALAAKMANTISQATELQRTYLPVDPVSVARADAARLRGRAKLRLENKNG